MAGSEQKARLGHRDGNLSGHNAPVDESNDSRETHLNGKLAREVVETELAGTFPGQVLQAKDRPDPAIFDLAVGHRQLMDFWLIQMARDHGYTLVTRDQALQRSWPQFRFLLI